MKVRVLAIVANIEIVQLTLVPSDQLLAEQSRVVTACSGQLPFGELHVTLACSSPLSDSHTLPEPPTHIEFVDTAVMAAREDKSSTYLRVSDSSQEQLAHYVRELEGVLGVQLSEESRVFHVSLSNLTGAPRGSIAKVWDHPVVPV